MVTLLPCGAVRARDEFGRSLLALRQGRASPREPGPVCALANSRDIKDWLSWEDRGPCMQHDFLSPAAKNEKWMRLLAALPWAIDISVSEALGHMQFSQSIRNKKWFISVTLHECRNSGASSASVLPCSWQGKGVKPGTTTANSPSVAVLKSLLSVMLSCGLWGGECSQTAWNAIRMGARAGGGGDWTGDSKANKYCCIHLISPGLPKVLPLFTVMLHLLSVNPRWEPGSSHN